jgi:hypothetical protein
VRRERAKPDGKWDGKQVGRQVGIILVTNLVVAAGIGFVVAAPTIGHAVRRALLRWPEPWARCRSSHRRGAIAKKSRLATPGPVESLKISREAFFNLGTVFCAMWQNGNNANCD